MNDEDEQRHQSTDKREPRPDSKRAKLVEAKKMEKKMAVLDKRTELLSIKYNQNVEGAKGLFENYNTRSNSCFHSQQTTSVNINSSSIHNCDQDSMTAEPAFSRENSKSNESKSPQKSIKKEEWVIVRSPGTASQKPTNRRIDLSINRNFQPQKQEQQNELPCSQFFKNDDNFEDVPTSRESSNQKQQNLSSKIDQISPQDIKLTPRNTSDKQQSSNEKLASKPNQISSSVAQTPQRQSHKLQSFNIDNRTLNDSKSSNLLRISLNNARDTFSRQTNQTQPNFFSPNSNSQSFKPPLYKGSSGKKNTNMVNTNQSISSDQHHATLNGRTIYNQSMQDDQRLRNVIVPQTPQSQVNGINNSDFKMTFETSLNQQLTHNDADYKYEFVRDGKQYLLTRIGSTSSLYEILDSQNYYHNGKRKKRVKKKKVRSSVCGSDAHSIINRSEMDPFSEQQKDQSSLCLDSFRQEITVDQSKKPLKLRKEDIRNSRFQSSGLNEPDKQPSLRGKNGPIDDKGSQRANDAIANHNKDNKSIAISNMKQDDKLNEQILNSARNFKKQGRIDDNSRNNEKPPEEVKIRDRNIVDDKIQQQQQTSNNFVHQPIIKGTNSQMVRGTRSQSLMNFKRPTIPENIKMVVPSIHVYNKENQDIKAIIQSKTNIPQPTTTIKELKVKLLQDQEQNIDNQEEKKSSIIYTQNQEHSILQKQLQQQQSIVPQRQMNQPPPPVSIELIKKHAGGDFPIHRFLFRKDFPSIVQYFRQGVFSVDNLNQKDHRGNTPILLAGKLSPKDDEYLKAVNYFFDKGANGKLRDLNGWSLMDEAISQQNTRLLAIVFDQLNKRKKERWERSKLSIFKKLKLIPDFYLELHWECQSSWIPFLSKIAPNDTYQIWKVGSYLRLDFSLVGIRKLQAKRRRMSILFRDTSETNDEYKNIDIMLINRDRKIIVNPLEDLDMDEKLAVLTDIINSEPLQNELNIEDQQWKECRNFVGQQITENINNYQCKKYKVVVKAQMQQRKRIQHTFDMSFDEYFTQVPEVNEKEKVTKISKDVKKTVESQLWLSHEFPLKISNFLTVLKTLSIGGNTSMQKMKDFLKNQSLKDVITSNGFPVKIQIPIGLLIKATVDFNKFSYLQNTPEFIQETFSIPSDCKYVSRKEGMKTLENKKKRLAFANLAT